MGPRASYRAVVAECAPIIGQCAPARVAISTQCAPATCVVIAPRQLAYQAVTDMAPLSGRVRRGIVAGFRGNGIIRRGRVHDRLPASG